MSSRDQGHNAIRQKSRISCSQTPQLKCSSGSFLDISCGCEEGGGDPRRWKVLRVLPPVLTLSHLPTRHHGNSSRNKWLLIYYLSAGKKTNDSSSRLSTSDLFTTCKARRAALASAGVCCFFFVLFFYMQEEVDAAGGQGQVESLVAVWPSGPSHHCRLWRAPVCWRLKRAEEEWEFLSQWKAIGGALSFTIISCCSPTTTSQGLLLAGCILYEITLCSRIWGD